MYEFGTFRLDENRGLLLDGDTPVPLTTKCLDTLLVLVRNSDQTVSKDVLLQTVWPGTFVEESNLTQHISMLRKALGEGPQDRRYIVTVPRQGYRFVAPVRELPPLDPTPPRIDPQPEPSPPALPTIPPSTARSRLWIAAAAILLLLIVAGTLWRHRSSSVHALTEKDSVLLADFENSTGEPVFDGALKQAIAIELGQSPFLDLVSTDHVRDTLKFMGRSPDEPIRSPLAREVCQRASAKALIAGSIARLGNSYVLAVNAMNCADATTLAQQQFEASRKEDVLPLLGKAASKLRSQLGESLTSIQRFDTPIAQATTPSLEALKAYSLGLEARTRGTERDAIPLFERAIAIDPKFATAYAQLGAVYSNLGETPRAGEYTRQAFELSDNLSEREKLYITARYYNATGDTAKAIDTFQVWTRLYPAIGRRSTLSPPATRSLAVMSKPKPPPVKPSNSSPTTTRPMRISHCQVSPSTTSNPHDKLVFRLRPLIATASIPTAFSLRSRICRTIRPPCSANLIGPRTPNVTMTC